MTPVSVLKILWRHKVSMITVLVLTLVAAAYVFFYAPRSYMASTVYVLVTPRVPTVEEMRTDPALAAANSDNPYLRSADSSLITQVMATKLSSTDVVDSLKATGLSPDYTVTLPATTGAGQLVRMEATGSSPQSAITTVEALGQRLTTTLRDAQKVNGADDRYLFTALQIDPPSKATEQFSSRLRSMIVVLIGGVILLFGAVSIARMLEASRSARKDATPKPRPASRRRRSEDRHVAPAGSGQDHEREPDISTPVTPRLVEDRKPRKYTAATVHDSPFLMPQHELQDHSFEERGSDVPVKR
ncbi:capsular polysaccharide biosynthesis protein [Pseudarthrobacter sp. W1I19]|uniref:chain-length determining protein n=1 Tax=Pseudarthrobacter sp. W1I19 TaxID=3042288 RepID=UPI002789468E|nr:chain-length determining protein [Pseudarthrobacter sp. W1I19]MDQ0925753.1 capsular polysaccharide biosynthesis protein [Pseudarthrobacter sp. W1I19]